MISFVKRLWRDKRGNALAIAGAALPLVVGSAGLASDTIQWALWKRQLQRAADSAAMAGVYAKAQGAARAQPPRSPRTSRSIRHTGIVAGEPAIRRSPIRPPASWNHGVQVTLAVQKRLGFSSLFISAAPTITATATAAMVDDGEYLRRGARETRRPPASTIGGSADVDLGCGVISNSISVDEIDRHQRQCLSPRCQSGRRIRRLADGVAARPGASNVQPYHMAQLDPYAGMFDMGIPPSVTCRANINSSGAR